MVPKLLAKKWKYLTKTEHWWKILRIKVISKPIIIMAESVWSEFKANLLIFYTFVNSS